MSKTLKTALWAKFVIVVLMFFLSFSLNFLILRTIEPEISFNLLIFGKPILVVVFILLLNLLFHFPAKISVPNIIPSTFLVLSFLVFVDLGYLIFKYYNVLSPHTSFWVIYGVILGVCAWNLQKYIRAFTVGLPD